MCWERAKTLQTCHYRSGIHQSHSMTSHVHAWWQISRITISRHVGTFVVKDGHLCGPTPTNMATIVREYLIVSYFSGDMVGLWKCKVFVFPAESSAFLSTGWQACQRVMHSLQLFSESHWKPFEVTGNLSEGIGESMRFWSSESLVRWR